MALFRKCPECGEIAFFQPKKNDKNIRFFRCKNGHEFRVKIQSKQDADEKEIMDHLPEWVRILNDMAKHRQFGG